MNPTDSTPHSRPGQVHEIETVIIGAGQAGLATAYQLQRRGRECVVLDAHARVGDNWRQQWDTLRLYSPAKYDALPGMPFPADPWSYPGKEQVADYLEQYAQRFRLPVRLDTRVQAVDRADPDGYRVDAGDISFRCRNVVVATGTFGRTPSIPEVADRLDPDILQLHSSEYRRPDQLRDGPVLVVGASHSGTDIAYELAADRDVLLAGRDCGQVPIRVDSPAIRLVFPFIAFAWQHVLSRRTPVGRKMLPHVRHHGAPMLRVKRADLADRSVERVTDRLEEVADGRPVVGGRPRDVANVVWATGFRQVFDWIHLPILGPDGWPEEMRGVSEKVPGFYFCGLSFQYNFASNLIFGAGRDGDFVAARIVDRARGLERRRRKATRPTPARAA